MSISDDSFSRFKNLLGKGPIEQVILEFARGIGPEDAQILSWIEGEYLLPDHGLSFTSDWSGNVLSVSIHCQRSKKRSTDVTEISPFGGALPAGILVGDNRNIVQAKLGRAPVETHLEQAPPVGLPEVSGAELVEYRKWRREGKAEVPESVKPVLKFFEMMDENDSPDAFVTDVYRIGNTECYISFLIENEELLEITLLPL